MIAQETNLHKRDTMASNNEKNNLYQIVGYKRLPQNENAIDKSNSLIYVQNNKCKTNIIFSNNQQPLNYRNRHTQNVAGFNMFDGANPQANLGQWCNSTT